MSNNILIFSNEQNEIFTKTENRKVILSTNIAESSLTIPDVSYVIDFCLMKEVKYNVKSGNETLELCWASKASSRQRAGRTGRTSQGFVFRLVPHNFFEVQMPAYSSAELLRVPLEKLILKIKIWDESIKDSNSLLREPTKILGRAIQPPQIQHISSAINNLHLYGALTKDENSSGKLTELGKVYAELPIDLKYSRLIMLANAFDMIEPAIVVSCILSQEKTIFRRNVSIKDSYEFKRTKTQDCDFTFMFKIYKDWEELFGKNIIIDKKSWKRNRTQQEDEYCRLLHLNSSILREVKLCIADITNRLNRLNLISYSGQGIFEKILTFNIDEDNKPILFRIILAGGFYHNYIKCQNVHDIEKMKKKVKYSELKQSITVKSQCIKDLSEKQIIEYFSEFGEVEQIFSQGDDVVVKFGEDYISSIHKVLSLSSNRSHEQLKIYENILRKPEYINELSCHDMLTKSSVEIDVNSINHIIIEENRNDIGHIFLVSDDFYLKNAKYIARYTSKLPKKPMLDQLLVLIFTPYASINPTTDNKSLHSFKPTGSDNYIRFSHLFSTEDLKNINKIRNNLNELITYNGENKYSIVDQLKVSLLRLINKSRRIKILNNENWKKMYEIYLEHPTTVQESSYAYSEEKFSSGFLPKLNAPLIKEDFRLFTPEGMKELEEERNKFNLMRNKFLEHIQAIKKKIDCEDAYLACECCKCYIAGINSIKPFANTFKITSYTGFISQIEDSSDLFDGYVDRIKNNYNNVDMQFVWLCCPSKKSIFGFKQDNFCYLTTDSKVVVEYPMSKEPIPWGNKPYLNDFSIVRNLVIEGKKKRDEWLSQNLKCNLCGSIKFKTPEDFLKHIKKDEIHQFNLNELLEEEFLEPEYNI